MILRALLGSSASSSAESFEAARGAQPRRLGLCCTWAPRPRYGCPRVITTVGRYRRDSREGSKEFCCKGSQGHLGIPTSTSKDFDKGLTGPVGIAADSKKGWI